MAGLRYRDISPFVSGRNQKINGVAYVTGDPITINEALACRNLDALISQHRIIPALYPYVDAPSGDINALKHPRPVHVPTVQFWWLVANGADVFSEGERSSEVAEGEEVTLTLDDEPADEAEEVTLTFDGVPDGTVDEVLVWVDGDVDRAREALAYEVDNKNRSTLISALNQIVESQ